MRSTRTLALRRELLTELSNEELRAAAAARPGAEDGTAGSICTGIIVATQISNLLVTIFGGEQQD